MTRPRKNPGASGIRTWDLPLSRRTPYHLANEVVFMSAFLSLCAPQCRFLPLRLTPCVYVCLSLSKFCVSFSVSLCSCLYLLVCASLLVSVFLSLFVCPLLSVSLSVSLLSGHPVCLPLCPTPQYLSVLYPCCGLFQ